MGRPVLGLLLVGNKVQAGCISVRDAPNLQPTATQEPDGPCGNQQYSRELFMMGIVVPETR